MRSSIDPPGDARPASAVREYRTHEGVDRVDVVGEAAGREQGFAVRGVTGLALCVAEPEEQRGPTALVVDRRPIQQVERLSVPAQRLVGRELGQGPSPACCAYAVALPASGGRARAQWWASSPIRPAGSSPQSSSSASATRRWVRPRRPAESSS